ncbi:MAG: tRNA guanosine(34) transglycosylase Tgt [Chlamydiia bacterium]
MFRFEILHQSKRSRARVGRIHTAHGVIDTPHFVPVGTHAAIKAVDSKLLDEMGIQLMFCNTYHLMIHPGAATVEALGGLHRFMGRQGPIITDSGGFQVFSLAYGGVHAELKSSGQKQHAGSVLKIAEEGVTFRSYRDGSKLLLTPESSVLAQKSLGADIIIPFDELPPYHIEPRALRRSHERTHRWQRRSLIQHRIDPRHQSMYGVVHGGLDDQLRGQSLRELVDLGFDGLAIGGSLGKNREEMVSMLSTLMPQAPSHLPVHLLGIADVPSIQSVLHLGIDTFDSSYPTKAARHGLLLTSAGPVKIDRACYQADPRPPDPLCSCFTCRHYSMGYLHHLFKAKELTAYTLASIHNLYWMVGLFSRMREAILRDEL